MSTFPEQSPFYAEAEKPIDITSSHARLALEEHEENVRKEAARKEAVDQAFTQLENLIEDVHLEDDPEGSLDYLEDRLEELHHAFNRAIR